MLRAASSADRLGAYLVEEVIQLAFADVAGQVTDVHARRHNSQLSNGHTHMAAPARVRSLIAPSLLSSDFAQLAKEAQRMLECGADWLHMDIMVRIARPSLRSAMAQPNEPCVSLSALHRTGISCPTSQLARQ